MTSAQSLPLTLMFSSRYWSVFPKSESSRSHDHLGYMFGKGVYFADVGHRCHYSIILIADFDKFSR